jgi:putative sterol carrier protein
MASKGQTLPDGWVTTLIGLTGRLAFEVDGETVAALQVGDERIEVTGSDADDADGAGEPRSLVTCPSEDDVRQILSGALDPVVAALQGRLVIDGDVLFGMKVLRALRAAPQPGAPAPAAGG